MLSGWPYDERWIVGWANTSCATWLASWCGVESSLAGDGLEFVDPNRDGLPPQKGRKQNCEFDGMDFLCFATCEFGDIPDMIEMWVGWMWIFSKDVKYQLKCLTFDPFATVSEWCLSCGGQLGPFNASKILKIGMWVFPKKYGYPKMDDL